MPESMACLYQICGFDIIDTLGHGANSTIYAVKDPQGQIYALKRVVKRDASDQRFLEQARNEHEVANKLQHPALRRSHRMIRHRKIIRTKELLILMELVDGLTLEEAALRDLVVICQLCQKVTVGLGAMHEAGYVHADIKPNNILVTDDHQIKIIDFGQSCPIGTVKARIQGTPDYIAPEQVHRREIMPTTDVFNLGATLYWLLTDKHVPTVIARGPNDLVPVNPDCPPPHEINPEVPPALSSLVMSCVKSQVEERPATMQQVHDRLELAIHQLNNRRAG